MPIEILHGYETNLKKAKEFKMPRPASTNRSRFDSYCARSLFNLNKCYSLPMNISNMAELFTLRMILLTRTQTVFFIFLPFFYFFFFYCDASWILIDVFDAFKYIPLCHSNLHSLFRARIVSISSEKQSCINWRSCAFLRTTMDIFLKTLL